jgi:hypothetical protein
VSSHVRKQIRDAVSSAITGLATTGSRVQQSRMYVRKDTDLPCLLVETAEERITQGAMGDLEHELTVVVRGFAKANADLDDTLDQIAAEVEIALHAAGALAGLVPGGMNPVSLSLDFDDGMEKPCGVVVMEYRATYYSRIGQPTAVI